MNILFYLASVKLEKIEKDWKIFYKNIYFCKSFSNGKTGRVFLCRQMINY